MIVDFYVYCFFVCVVLGVLFLIFINFYLVGGW